MYLSMGYIHLVAIGPHICDSSTRCYNKWVMMSKREGGKCISTNVRLTKTSNWSDSMLLGFQALRQSLLNTLEILITAIHGPKAKDLSMPKAKFVALAHDNHGILRHQKFSTENDVPSLIHELILSSNSDDGYKNIKLNSCQFIWGY